MTDRPARDADGVPVLDLNAPDPDAEAQRYAADVLAWATQPHPEFPCPTAECPGDARYAAPGRRHREGCTHPLHREADA